MQTPCQFDIFKFLSLALLSGLKCGQRLPSYSSWSKSGICICNEYDFSNKGSAPEETRGLRSPPIYHMDSVLSVAVVQQPIQFLLSGSRDGVIKIWRWRQSIDLTSTIIVFIKSTIHTVKRNFHHVCTDTHFLLQDIDYFTYFYIVSTLQSLMILLGVGLNRDTTFFKKLSSKYRFFKLWNLFSIQY